MSKRKKIAITLLILGIIAASIAFGIHHYHTHYIDLNNYLTIVYDGYSGNATAKLEMDYKALQEDYGDILVLPDELKGRKSDIDGVSPAVYYFGKKYSDDGDEEEFWLYPRRGVSNGDTMHFSGYDSVEYDDEFGCWIIANSHTVQASGITSLEEADPDPFAGLKVVYDGGDSQAVAEVDTSGMDWPFYMTVYELSKDSYLSNGDQITVSISDYDLAWLYDNYDYIPSQTSETVTVSGLPALTDDNQVSRDRDLAAQAEEETENEESQSDTGSAYEPGQTETDTGQSSSSWSSGDSYQSSYQSDDDESDDYDDAYADDREEWGDEYDEEDYDSEYFDYDEYDEEYYDEDY